jgi:hypothetical protein
MLELRVDESCNLINTATGTKFLSLGIAPIRWNLWMFHVIVNTSFSQLMPPLVTFQVHHPLEVTAALSRYLNKIRIRPVE